MCVSYDPRRHEEERQGLEANRVFFFSFSTVTTAKNVSDDFRDKTNTPVISRTLRPRLAGRSNYRLQNQLGQTFFVPLRKAVDRLVEPR